MTRLAAVLLAVLVLGLVGACGPDDQAPQAAGTGTATRAPATSEPASTAPADTTAPSSTPPADTTTPPPTTTAGTPPAPAAGRWVPEPGTTWQYQLSGELDLSVDAAVFDVDWEDTSAAQVAQLHAAGRRVVCYVNAGAFEEWRPDAARYAAEVLGEPLDGWPGERWLDIRRTDLLLPLIAARMDTCRAKGFDAVEADNVDGWANDSGFDLTAADQVAFNTAVAGLAHDRGLSIALKNDVEQIAELEPFFDFAVNEECLSYDECDAYEPFHAAGKAILHVEYERVSAAGCRSAGRMAMSTILKSPDLGPDLEHC